MSRRGYVDPKAIARNMFNSPVNKNLYSSESSPREAPIMHNTHYVDPKAVTRNIFNSPSVSKEELRDRAAKVKELQKADIQNINYSEVPKYLIDFRTIILHPSEADLLKVPGLLANNPELGLERFREKSLFGYIMQPNIFHTHYIPNFVEGLCMAAKVSPAFSNVLLKEIKVAIETRLKSHHQFSPSSNNNFLHDFSTYLNFHGDFKNKEYFATLLEFVDNNTSPNVFTKYLMEKNINKLDPFNLMTSQGQFSLVNYLINSKYFDILHDSIINALLTSEKQFCNLMQYSHLKESDELLIHLKIGRLLAGIIPDIAEEVFAQALNDLPDSLNYEKMLLDNNISPFMGWKLLTILCEGQLEERIIKEDINKSALELLSYAFSSSKIKEAITNVKVAFPYLESELKSGLNILQIVLNHNLLPEGNDTGFESALNVLQCLKLAANTIPAGSLRNSIDPLVLAFPLESDPQGIEAAAAMLGQLHLPAEHA